MNKKFVIISAVCLVVAAFLFIVATARQPNPEYDLCMEYAKDSYDGCVLACGTGSPEAKERSACNNVCRDNHRIDKATCMDIRQ